MNESQQRALEALRFDWAVAPDDVWERSPFHVDDLHGRAAAAVLGGIEDARTGSGASPIGLVIQGQRGVGKTHMLGWVREQMAYRGGYFFLVGLYEADRFWESVSLGVVEGLLRVTSGDSPQVVQALTRLAHRAGMPDDHRAAITGAAPLTLEALDAFVAGVRRLDKRVHLSGQDTLRALVLYASPDDGQSDVGFDHLTSVGAMEDERRRWGIRHAPRSAQRTLSDVSRLLALTGPTVVAVDQVDALIAESRHQLTQSGDEDLLVIDQVAAGLMSLREVTRRTLSLLACLPDTWERITSRAIGTVGDRFRESTQLRAIPSVEVGRDLVAKRFGSRFRRIGFVPPHPTWPVADAAFVDAVEFTPRRLLQVIDRHVEACLSTGDVRELVDLKAHAVTAGGRGGKATPERALAELDRRFDQLRREADVSEAAEPTSEDEVVPRALTAGLSAWIAELGEEHRAAFALDALPGRKPPLHARLKQTLDEGTEHEAHWSFRAIGARHGVAALSKLRAARTASGLQAGTVGRHLVLLRRGDWSKGEKTQAELGAMRALGAQEHELTEEDLRTFFALEALLRDRPDHLQAWVSARRPASTTKLLDAVLGGVAQQYALAAPADATTAAPAATPPADDGGGAVDLDEVDGQAGPGDQVELFPADAGRRQPDLVSDAVEGAAVDLDDEGAPGTLLVGVASDSRAAVRLSLESLRRHTAIFAGSGSGKTVLIRRLIEACARQGVSAIVLDPNNDLARLGDPWPDEPAGWLQGDAERAADYFAGTEVVVWTPGRESGNPLSFRPLPAFAAVLDDQDEFDAAVEAAVSTLAPHAKVDGRTARAQLGRAVLKEALRYFAEADHGGLPGFIEVLSSLPVGVSGIKDANRIGRDIAQLLTAATVNDPLFGGAGAAADPGMLLTPSPGKRARVSVVNFVGLPADEARQGFVNQLQMALFAWVKAHPAGDRPLGGLFVMDEAQTLAPSGEMTPSTRSTLTLASQARKYGLGLVFATQAPKGLHNRIPGNAFTQFFGYLNSPAQIAVANEMARVKGSRVPDISRVDTGEFFVSGQGVAFQRTKVPLCLTHHPASPLTTEEVLDRARASAAAIGRSNGPG